MGFVIGTAGHIDHGKTSLVRLLSGQDTDQLAAEKQRGISIDLGFADFELPDKTPVGIVDVPGHERFIRNMVAGAHGLDLVLFVIAADDGVMPQSEEHFDIICSLGVKLAIFVITKIDRVDGARLEEVKQEIAILTDGSAFQRAPIVPVSNVQGTGIDGLKALIAKTLGSDGQHERSEHFRMPIDRAFTIHGRGVVVTGTLLAGRVKTGDAIAIVPGVKTCRVRGLQRHGIDVEEGRSGERIALNLSGVDLPMLDRGDVACDPAIARQTQCIDVALSLSPHAVADVKNGQRLRLHLGTAERLGTVIVLGIVLGKNAMIHRGSTGFAQIKLSAPLQAMTGDLFVIRDEQAEHTLGGGKVVDPVGVKAKRTDALRLAWLTALEENNWPDAIGMLIDSSTASAILATDLMFRMNLSQAALDEMIKTNENLLSLTAGSENWVTSTTALEALKDRIKLVLEQFHKDEPSAPGIGPEAVHHRLGGGLDGRWFQQVVDLAVAAGDVVRHDGLLAHSSHRAGLTKSQQKLAADIIIALEENPFSPPAFNPRDSEQNTVIAHLERQGKVVRVAKDIAFGAAAFAMADQRLEDHLVEHGDISAAQYRDGLATTRKYALALLEYFDRTGRTVRMGDIRKRGKPRSETLQN